MAPVTQNKPDAKEPSVENDVSHKLRKLQVEKVRRDRINHSIEQLRTLLHNGEKKADQASKLEKADILELAVGFLRQRAMERVASPSYPQGFSQCLQETLRHLSLHAPLRPAEREDIKRFYVLQKTALQRHVSGKQARRTVAAKRSSARSSSARSRGSLWRPW